MNRRQMILRTAGAGLAVPFLGLPKLRAQSSIPQLSPGIAPAANSAIATLFNQTKANSSGITSGMVTNAYTATYNLFNNMSSVGANAYIETNASPTALAALPPVNEANATQLATGGQSVGANLQPSDFAAIVNNPSAQPGIVSYINTSGISGIQATLLQELDNIQHWGTLEATDEKHGVRGPCDYAGIIGDSAVVLGIITFETPWGIPLSLLGGLFLLAKDVIC